jgi:predicted RNA-binding protein with RPS1 domain
MSSNDESNQTHASTPPANTGEPAAPAATPPVDAPAPAGTEPAQSPAPPPAAPAVTAPPAPAAPPTPMEAVTKAKEQQPALTDEVHAEIEAALSELEQAKKAIAEPHARPAIRGPRVVEAGREHRTGTVVSVGPTDIFVEFGPKELGVVPRSQYKDDEVPTVNSTLDVVITRYEASESLFVCAKPGAVQKADWEALHPGQTVEARVTGVNKGGLELEIANHRAFMPAGQVSLDRIEDLSVFVGEKITCQVQKIDRRGKGNIVLTRRDLLAKEREEQAGKLKETLAEGQVVEGIVRKIMPFGAFVDLGGVDGLVHVTDLTHERVGQGEKAIEKYIKVGQKVAAQILKLDWEAGRISLGMKQLQDDPFKAQIAELQEGAELSGKVVKIMDFGAFIEVAPGVEGLVHISELAYRRVGQVSDVLTKDEVVQVKILGIDAESHRISLSIKALLPAPKPQGGKGGRGRKEEQGPSVEEIMKETPHLRRLREQAKQREKTKKRGSGGLDDLGYLGGGLGDLKL